jgi:heme oxygenase (mycobilin-producing)
MVTVSLATPRHRVVARVCRGEPPRLWARGQPGLVGGCRSGPTRWQAGRVTTIKINAITVPAGSGDELAHRFAARAGAVDGAEGFEGFELLRPTDEREQWLVITRWRDEESFQAWVSSPGFAEGHRSAVERAGVEAPRPVSTHSEVWNYEVAGGSTPTAS